MPCCKFDFQIHLYVSTTKIISEYNIIEYGVVLTELTLQHDGILQIRQMAALLLKQYVDTHWTSTSEKFKGPETSPQAKATIRQMLPHGLKESISKVRKLIFFHNTNVQ